MVGAWRLKFDELIIANCVPMGALPSDPPVNSDSVNGLDGESCVVFWNIKVYLR
jgi:hypothetical protein